MSEKTSTQTLSEVLGKTDEQILSNWASLGSLIKNFENVSWQNASKMARELLRDGNAMDYIEQVRSDLAAKDKGNTPTKSEKAKAKSKAKTDPPKKKEKKTTKAKVIPMNTKRDRFSMNFKRLVKIAPQIVERLEKGEEIYGKSKSTGYMDFNLELIHKNKRGYYLALSQYFKQNGDMVPDPDMQVLFNVKNQTLEALAFQNQFYYREVYDNIYDPKLVNEKERQSQNSFLEQWLINLDNQDHSVKWVDDDDSTKPVETQTKKPHIDDFPIELVTRLREEAEKKTLGDLRKALATYLSGKGEFTPLFHFVTAERINEITKSSEAKYPMQEALTNQSLEEFDEYGKQRKTEESKAVSVQSQKPNTDEFPDEILKVLRAQAEGNSLDDLRGTLANHLEGKDQLTPLFHFITAERINEITNSNEAKYPTQVELSKQALEEKEDFDLLRTQDDEGKSQLVKALTGPQNSQGSKPDISFIDPAAIEDAKKYVSSMMTLDDVIQAYYKHKKGELKVFAHVLYFMVERINDSPIGSQLPYPTTEDLKRDYQRLMEFRLKQSKVEESLQRLEESNIHRENYNKLIQFIPSLSNHLRDHGKDLKLESKHEGLLYDFYLEVSVYNEDGSAELHIFEGGKLDELLVQHSAMNIYFKPNSNEVFALSTMLEKGERDVYKNRDTLSGANKSELKQQNDFLGKWLDDLIEQGHKINIIHPMASEVIDEFQIDDENSKENTDKVEDNSKSNVDSELTPEIEKTAKHWKKLAAFISQKEGLDKKAAKEKALELKAEGKAEDYLIGKIERTAKISDNQLLKMNFQKLNRLFPIDALVDKGSSRRMLNSMNDTVLLILHNGMIGKYAMQIDLEYVDGRRVKWALKVQKNTSKVQVIKYDNSGDHNEIEFVNLDQKFGMFLDEKLKQNLKLAPLITEMFEKYPIVIEWTEGSHEMFIGLDDLQELRSKLKRYGFTDSPTETYIKNKVWFRGYSSDVRIDVSYKDGDYNPKKMELLDWLEIYDPNFDWYQYDNETDVTELQKKADKIPTFEVGKVELTKEHKRAGLTQKHINWINKNEQGMIITPVKRMTNNTRDFFGDLTKKAQQPGKRISRTGRIYYETRSNRSDISKHGL